ncbi:MAG: FUSC family protein [Chthoniobacterales bacterium]
MPVKNALLQIANRLALLQAIRTALAAVTSLSIAHLFKMPEVYWAAITTIIVMQSTLGAAWDTSKQRLIGTALGAAGGAFLSSYFQPGATGIATFGLALFILGLICGICRFEQAAYKFAGITLALVLLIPKTLSPWVIGMHRFFEVSLGISIALLFSALWPQAEKK